MSVDDVSIEFAELMRRVDPAKDVRDERTPAEIDGAIARIVADRGRPARGERPVRRDRPAGSDRRWPWIALPAAAILATAVFAVVQLVGPWAPLSAAATPPALEVTPRPDSFGEIMDAAIDRVRSMPDAESVRHAEFEGWYLQADLSSEPAPSVIAPQRHRLTWSDDLSGDLLVTAGAPYGPDGSAAPSGDAPPEGTVLVSERYDAGEAPVLFTGPPPSEVDELRSYLALALGEVPSDGASSLTALRVLLSEWRPSPAVQAAMLELMRTTGDFEVVGDVTDRLGRAGVVVRTTSTYYEYLAILSRETGALIALESVYRGGLELDVPVGSVVDYIAWT